jgi:hypothetical protein
MEQLAAEIEQQEKEAYGDPEAVQAVEATKTQLAESEEETLQPTTVNAEEPTETVTEKSVATKTEPKEDWKKRFTNFKASSDATIHGLRQEVLYLKEELQKTQDGYRDLTKKLSETPDMTDPYKDLFTQEEKDLVGEETLQALYKASKAIADSKVKPIQEQLEKEREKQRKRDAISVEQEKANLQATFLSRLEELVPDYRVLDVNPKFLQWMKEPEDISGYPREVIFKRAQAGGDVKRVAGFFLDFKELTKPKDLLAGKITPTSSASVTQVTKQTPKKPVITTAFIDKFYSDYVKGVYKNRQKEAGEIEKLIDDHVRSLAA